MGRLKIKIDMFLWAFMWMLPFLAYFVAWFRIGSAPELLSFIDQSYAFPFIKDIVNNVWQNAFGSTMPLAGFISYLVAVEIIHCLFDVVVFIPRMAHTFVDKFVSFAGGDRH